MARFNLRRCFPAGPFVNPITTAFETFGLIEPKLVASCDFDFTWPETDDEGVTDFYPEVSTIYLVQYPSGRRSYRVYEYGFSKQKDAHEMHLGPVMAWIYGGLMPKGYALPREPAQIVPLRLVQKPTKA